MVRTSPASHFYSSPLLDAFNKVMGDRWELMITPQLGNLHDADNCPSEALEHMYSEYAIEKLYTTIKGEAFTRRVYKNVGRINNSLTTKGVLDLFAMLTDTVYSFRFRYNTNNAINGLLMYIVPIDDRIVTTEEIDYLVRAYTFLLPADLPINAGDIIVVVCWD